MRKFCLLLLLMLALLATASSASATYPLRRNVIGFNTFAFTPGFSGYGVGFNRFVSPYGVSPFTFQAFPTYAYPTFTVPFQVAPQFRQLVPVFDQFGNIIGYQ